MQLKHLKQAGKMTRFLFFDAMLGGEVIRVLPSKPKCRHKCTCSILIWGSEHLLGV